MKRYFSLLSLILMAMVATTGYSQGVWEAYRYSQQYNEGTARSVAMGNAFVALGGDMGAISINPASSGVYRYHEFTVTPSITVATSDTDYLGSSLSDSKTRFGVPNFGYIATFNTGRKSSGLINWNLGLALNKTNNYTSRTSVAGRTAESSFLGSLAQRTNGIYAPDMDMNMHNDPFYYFGPSDWTSILGWNTSLLDTLPDSKYDYIGATENIDGFDIYTGGPLDQYYMRESIGNTAEATINFAGNISNKFFFGFNLDIVSIWYKESEYYSERAVNPNDFQTQFQEFDYSYKYSTTGTGINLKAGFIYVPVKWFRVGASISTPTWMYLYEEWDEKMYSRFADGYSQELISPLGTFNYRLNTPFRWNVGVATTIGGVAAISVDYESADYSRMKLIDEEYADTFISDNQTIKRDFTAQHIVRVGGEVKLTEVLALRAGYQYYSSGYKNNDSNIQVESFGLGYASPNGFFADFTYQQYMKKAEERFQLYDDILDENGTVLTPAPIATNRYGNWKLLLSIGFRF